MRSKCATRQSGGPVPGRLVAMNRYHRWYCRSHRWAKRLQGAILPGVLKGVDLGDNLLEIGPGPGVATDWLRQRAANVTAIEIDARLAESLRKRFHGTNVTVVEGDATCMSFPDGRFSGAVAFTMLHHVPYAVQDRLFSEAARVLRAGGHVRGHGQHAELELEPVSPVR